MNGLFRHHKGGRYYVFGVATVHEHNGDKDVIYLSLAKGEWNTRPLRKDSRNQDSWLDLVSWPDGKLRHRFISEEQAIDEHIDDDFFMVVHGPDGKPKACACVDPVILFGNRCDHCKCAVR